MTRHALEAAGFVRHEKNGIVWWESFRHHEIVRSRPPNRLAQDDVNRDVLVLVHGANDQAGTWFPVAAALARTHPVIVPDLAGHGESAPFQGPIPIPLLLQGLHTAIGDASDITLVGNSLGGWLVMLYTLEHPDRVKNLVLEAAGGLSIPLATDIVAHDREEALVILRAVHGPNYVPQEWVIDSLLARAVDSPMLRITDGEHYILDARLRELQVPATLIWGADDGVLPLSYAEALRAGIRGATLHVIEGAAHIPHLQQPERTLACLMATF